MRRNTGGFVTIGTAAAMMVWAFFGNVILQKVVQDVAPTTALTTAPTTDSSTSQLLQEQPEQLVSYEELRELNRQHRGAIKLCYSRAARRFHLQRRQPSRVDVTLELKDGAATAVVQSIDPKLSICIQRVVQQYRFSDNVIDQTVTFPLILAR